MSVHVIFGLIDQCGVLPNYLIIDFTDCPMIGVSVT